MAGHSQFKNIMFRKGAQDKKRSKVFSKLSREITVAAKMGGSDPAMNARLRLAIQNARAENMPKDNIERAVKKSSGNDADNFDEVRYEGYAGGGVAIIVEALTDNRNRTAGNLRTIFSKGGGSMAETGSVSFMFERLGEIIYPVDTASADTMLEAVLLSGATDIQSDSEVHQILCKFEDLGSVSANLQEQFGEAQSVKPLWRPNTRVEVDADRLTSVLKLIDTLEEDDDVQQVYANYDVSDEILNQLSDA